MQAELNEFFCLGTTWKRIQSVRWWIQDRNHVSPTPASPFNMAADNARRRQAPGSKLQGEVFKRVNEEIRHVIPAEQLQMVVNIGLPPGGVKPGLFGERYDE